MVTLIGTLCQSTFLPRHLPSPEVADVRFYQFSVPRVLCSPSLLRGARRRLAFVEFRQRTSVRLTAAPETTEGADAKRRSRVTVRRGTRRPRRRIPPGAAQTLAQAR